MYKGIKNMMVIGMVAIVLAICVYLLTRIYQQCLFEYRINKALSIIANIRDIADVEKVKHEDAWK